MNCAGASLHPLRLVGDPVDVVTGANLDEHTDFRLAGPLPLEWRRYYDSSKHRQAFALGWGHSHHYARKLVFDLDGVTYCGPLGAQATFPPLFHDGAIATHSGHVLRRVGRLLYRLTSPANLGMEFQFRDAASPGLLMRLFRPEGAISFRYNALNQLEEIVDSTGRRIQIVTDAAGRVTTLALVGEGGRPGRTLLTYLFDEKGNLTKGTDPWGHEFSFAYDHESRMVRRTDRNGFTFRFEYGADGRCVRSFGQGGLHDVRLRHLPAERVTVVTHGDGAEWTYFYDESHSLTRIIDPLGAAKEFVHGPGGWLEKELGPTGDLTRVLHTTAGAPAGRLSPLKRFIPANDGARAAARWLWRLPNSLKQCELGDLFGWESQSWLQAEQPVVRSLDESIRRALRLAPALQAAAGPAPVARSPRGGSEFDDFGLLVREHDFFSPPRRYQYDPSGNVRRFTDHDGAERTFEIGGWNQILKDTDALGRAVRYEYTSREQVNAVVDRGGTRSEYVYDLKDRLIEIRRHGQLQARFEYDAADRLVARLDGQGRTLFRIKRGVGGLLQERELASGETHTFEHDPQGRLLACAGQAGTVQFAYNRWGIRARDQRDGMGVVHEFHPFGELRSTTIFDRFRTEFHLRGSNRLTIQDPTGARHTVRSLVPGLIERTYACGSLELAQFDPRGRCAMKAVWQGRDDPKPWIRSFQFSGESDLIRVEDSSRGGQRFRYDQAHRLVGAESANGSQETYEYDAGDNLLRGPGLEGVSLLSGNRIQTANGEAFQYDDRQNVASRASSHRRITFAYDSRNFLTACNGPGLEWRAEYDPLGRRTRVAVNGRSRRFFWDGDRLAAELAADGGLRIYVYPDLMAFVPCLFIDYDSVEDDPRAGRRHAIFTDHLGAPVRVHDASGQPVWQARYTPYGLARVEASGSIDFALRRPGQYFDKDTGLHYNRYRYYDPVLGRFLQPDPLDISGGLNLYGYSTSPLSVLDLLGLNACPVCAKGGHDNGHDPESDPGSARLPKPSEIEPVERPPGSRPFDDLPSLEGKSAQQVREILEGAGFTQTQHERTLPSADGTGRSVVTDSRGGSEIWMRRDQNGNYEAVRIDQHGHDRPPPMRPGGPREGESFAGEPPHVHREYIPNDQARRDGAAYPPNHPQAGQSVLPPGSTAGDAADSYNQGFTPGVYDSYNDGGAQVPNNDFGQTHTPLGS